MFQSDLIQSAEEELNKNGWDGDRHGVRVIGSLIRQAIPINIQPVADYLYQGTEQEDWYLDRDFPNLAPPWELSWMHWNPPTWFRSEGTLVRAPQMADFEYGCLVVGMSTGKLWEDTVEVNGPEKYLMPPAGQTAKWLACFYLFGRNKTTNKVNWYHMKFFVNAQGEGLFDGGGLYISDPREWPSGTWHKAIHDVPLSPKSRLRDPNNDVIGTMFPICLAISFCHCKNVTVEDIPVPDKVLKKRASKGIWSPKIRREIHIEPMRKILRETPGTGPSDIKRQLAIRRGHFKDYKEGRGLFGKHHGLYWWENWVRDASGVKYQIEGKSA